MFASVVLRITQHLLGQLLLRAGQGSLTSYDVVVQLMWLRLVVQLLVLSSTISDLSRSCVSVQLSSPPQDLQVHLYAESYQHGILLTAYERQMRSQHSYRI